MKNYKILVPFDLQLVLSNDEKEKPFVLLAGLYDVISDNETHDSPACVAEIKLSNGKSYNIPFGQATIYGYEYAAMSVTAEADFQLLEEMYQKPDAEVFELLESKRPHKMTVYEYVFGEDSTASHAHLGFNGDFHRALRAALLYDWSFTPCCKQSEVQEFIHRFNCMLFL